MMRLNGGTMVSERLRKTAGTLRSQGNMNFLDPATPEQISEFERKNFQFYSYVLEMTLQVSEASLKCHHCKKSFSDELKAIKTKNDSGAVSYENIRIFSGSLRWHAAALI